jgi:hypothetical protein
MIALLTGLSLANTMSQCIVNGSKSDLPQSTSKENYSFSTVVAISPWDTYEFSRINSCTTKYNATSVPYAHESGYNSRCFGFTAFTEWLKELLS